MASTALAAPASKHCYNKDCTEAKPERPRIGWRLRNGDYGELCNRCASIYEEGRFCDIFHVNAAGWRTCESCGKQVHCGCIVSAFAFTLLDPGGIECVTCARKDVPSLARNPAWPTSLLFHSPSPDRFNGLCGKNWNQLAGSGPVPWRQAPSLFNSIPRAEMQPRASYEIDGSTSIDRLEASERYPTSSIESKRVVEFSERFMNNVKISVVDNYYNGSAGPKSDVHLNPCISNSQQSISLKEEPSAPTYGLAVPYALLNETNGHLGVAGPHFRPAPPPTLAKHFYGNVLNDINSPSENPIRNGRPRGDPRGKSQLLPRYLPKITDQELQKISGASKSVITPLFEKMLSVSDAGKIGRLVLPKKCAEAYFPQISQPEGLPLKVQDAKGSEWTFQFRFWPNNNSRMYVLEGVTPCIQSMQLQAGDVVTFSRLEPGGKLIMGFRKATAAPSDQVWQTIIFPSGLLPARSSDATLPLYPFRQKENEVAKAGNCMHDVNGEVADPNSWSKGDKSGYIAKEVLGSKSFLSRKRKNTTLGSKSKRLRIEDDDIIELKLSWEEAQGLLRPPPNLVPRIVMIEGFEFEEYEDAPVLGKPTLFTSDNRGEKIQWVQCEECMKWRKLRAECLLPSRWTCADTSWDPERSSCSAAQELTPEQIEDVLLFSSTTTSGLKKTKKAKVEALEGLDALAHMAILGGGGGDSTSTSAAAAATTTKHPRHRAGCTCIVCIQPPSGKGPKHKQTCTCNVCLTVKRRFRTLMLRREKKQQQQQQLLDKKKKIEPEAEGSAVKKQQQHLPNKKDGGGEYGSVVVTNNNTSSSHKKRRRGRVGGGGDDDEDATSSVGSDAEEEERNKLKSSPFKGRIDLNIQPEREEDLSPHSDPTPTPTVVNLRLIQVQDADDKQQQQQQQEEVVRIPSTTTTTTTTTSIENHPTTHQAALPPEDDHPPLTSTTTTD